MYGKGVVAVMLIGASLSAHDKTTESLLEGISRSGSSAPHYSFSTTELRFLEYFFEDFSDFAKVFNQLSSKKQDELLDPLGDLIESFFSMLPELLDEVEKHHGQINCTD